MSSVHRKFILQIFLFFAICMTFALFGTILLNCFFLLTICFKLFLFSHSWNHLFCRGQFIILWRIVILLLCIVNRERHSPLIYRIRCPKLRMLVILLRIKFGVTQRLSSLFVFSNLTIGILKLHLVQFCRSLLRYGSIRTAQFLKLLILINGGRSDPILDTISPDNIPRSIRHSMRLVGIIFHLLKSLKILVVQILGKVFRLL